MQYIDLIQTSSMLDQIHARLLRLQDRLLHVPPHWEVKAAKRFVSNQLRMVAEDIRLSDRGLGLASEKQRRRRLRWSKKQDDNSPSDRK